MNTADGPVYSITCPSIGKNRNVITNTPGLFHNKLLSFLAMRI